MMDKELAAEEFIELMKKWKIESKTIFLPIPIFLYNKYKNKGVRLSTNDWDLTIDFNHCGCNSDYKAKYQTDFGSFLKNYLQQQHTKYKVYETEDNISIDLGCSGPCANCSCCDGDGYCCRWDIGQLISKYPDLYDKIKKARKQGIYKFVVSKPKNI